MTPNELMQRIEHLERRLSASEKRKRRFWVAVAIIIPMTLAYAVTKPHADFADGDIISASKINDNFNTLYTATQQRLGTYCGITGSTYNGAGIGGYSGGKSKCETACSNSNAHMCTGHEMSISLQQGLVPTTTMWVATSVASDNGTEVYDDCSAFSVGTTVRRGTTIQNRVPVQTVCSAAHDIACCL